MFAAGTAKRNSQMRPAITCLRRQGTSDHFSNLVHEKLKAGICLNITLYIIIKSRLGPQLKLSVRIMLKPHIKYIISRFRKPLFIGEALRCQLDFILITQAKTSQQFTPEICRCTSGTV